MLGNNIESVKSYRMTVPLTLNGTNATAGTKFYFPETPAIESKNIVGIEGHLASNAGLVGDLNLSNVTNIQQSYSTYLFFTIFDEDGSEKFYNVPFSAICLNDSILSVDKDKKVYPYIGRIKTRKSYFTFPPGVPLPITSNFVASLTFFYNQ
jgi:hypothetical protein